MKEMTYNYAEAITNNTVLKTELILSPITKIANNYKWIIENKRLSSDSIFGITRKIIGNNPEIVGCAIAYESFFFKEKGRYFAPYSCREKGNIKTFQLGSTEYEYFVMDWYQIPASIQKPYWSEPYFDTGGANTLITTFSMPFYSMHGKEKSFAGVITIDVALDWLTDIVSSVKILETGYASVLSRNGTFVTHPKKELMMNQTIFSYASEMNNPELRTIGREMQKGKTGFVSSTLNGVERVLYYTPLPSSNWTLAVVFPKSEMFLPLRKITVALIFLVVIGLILLTFIVSRIVSRQISPLEIFAKSAREVANGNFNNKLPDIKSKDEMKHLHDSFEHMQKDLSTYIEHLKSTTSAKEKIESELRIAREIQMGMIPKIFPPFPNLSEIDLFATLQPAKEVGGDLYDFFLIDDKHLCFAIGDVSGKGVPASLFMAVTRTLLRSLAPNQLSTAVIVNALNKSLSAGNESNMFVTFFLGILDVESGILKYSNAGHNPPLLVHPDGTTEFFELTKDIPVGLFDDFDYGEKVLNLSKNDKLFLYTDGVTEAEDAEEKLYSDQKLIDCVRAHFESQTKDLIHFVAEDIALHVKGNQQSDDLTMLSIVYYGNQDEGSL
ncbi:MAG: SpoIIE family protein phosphatase [Bacteroidales bacterium]|nr:SpoIIE family protein phosphatase [Bacteroidales bacterium]